VSIFETFSKRQKRIENAGKQDVYSYDDFPKEFRVQVTLILPLAVGRYIERDFYPPRSTEF